MKIAILGTENSHAYAFAKLIKEEQKYQDIEIIGAYGYDDAANQRLMEEKLVGRIGAHPHEFLGQVDGILVTARHGDHHHEYALPYLKTGVAAFVDKPFAVDLGKVDEMMNIAKETGALVCGGSSLKFLDEFKPLKRYLKGKTPVGGYVSSPVNMVNPYGGFYFYAQHLIECLFSVFGMDVKSVYARCEDQEKNRISIIFDYGDFDVTAQFYDCYTYAVSVFCKEGSMMASVTDVAYCYERELDEFIAMVQSGKMPHTHEELARPVQLLHYIEESYLQKKEIKTPW